MFENEIRPVETIAIAEVDTELYIAVDRDNLEKVKELLEKGAANSINTPDEVFGFTTFHKAATHNNLAIVKLLINSNPTEAHFGLNHVNCIGESPLFVAVEKNNFEIVKLFVDHGADIEYTGSREKCVKIAFKSNNIDIKIAQYLVAYGADIKDISLHLGNLQDRFKLTVLNVAKFTDKLFQGQDCSKEFKSLPQYKPNANDNTEVIKTIISDRFSSLILKDIEAGNEFKGLEYYKTQIKKAFEHDADNDKSIFTKDLLQEVSNKLSQVGVQDTSEIVSTIPDLEKDLNNDNNAFEEHSKELTEQISSRILSAEDAEVVVAAFKEIKSGATKPLEDVRAVILALDSRVLANRTSKIPESLYEDLDSFHIIKCHDEYAFDRVTALYEGIKLHDMNLDKVKLSGVSSVPELEESGS